MRIDHCPACGARVYATHKCRAYKRPQPHVTKPAWFAAALAEARAAHQAARAAGRQLSLAWDADDAQTDR